MVPSNSFQHRFNQGVIKQFINATCPMPHEGATRHNHQEVSTTNTSGSNYLNDLLSLPFEQLIRQLVTITNLSYVAFADTFKHAFGVSFMGHIESDAEITLIQANQGTPNAQFVVIRPVNQSSWYRLSSTPWSHSLDFHESKHDGESCIAYALPETIEGYLDIYNNKQEGIDHMTRVIQELSLDAARDEQETETISDNTPAIVRFVDQILEKAHQSFASDVHINPNPTQSSTIKMRVDGECETLLEFPALAHNAVIARLKIMAQLDIAEKRLPQDGKIVFAQHDDVLEIRVAILPTVNGESAVLRLINKSLNVTLTDLSMSDANLSRITQALKASHGLLLVVGPTGSGKTTTLHALLATLNQTSKSIWTIEDPVEISQPGINQVQANHKVGLDFARALRAFLRADPDIILVGEMRDRETARIAHEAALTGHLVLSTLHTNSACETITRLLDLNIEPLQIADTCRAILAQRLVKRLCSNCKASHPITDTQLQLLTQYLGHIEGSLPSHLSSPVGCATCRDTGYQGRIAIFELLIISPTIKRLIKERSSTERLLEVARQEGLFTLSEDALRVLNNGEIDLKQIISIHEGLHIYSS